MAKTKLGSSTAYAVGSKGREIADNYKSPLNGRMMVFARLVADGATLTDAFQRAGYSTAGHSQSYLSSHVDQLVKNPKVAAEIARLKAAQGMVSTWTRNEMIDMLHHIAAEAYEQSHPVTATETAEDGTMQDVVVRKYDASAAAVALKAVEQAAKMCGFNEPDKVDTSVTVQIVGDDELSD